MKQQSTLFLSFLLFLSSSLFASDLQYTIRPVFHENKTALAVDLEFTGTKEGMTTISLPSFFSGQNELYQHITDLSSDSRLEHTDLMEEKLVFHKPNEKVTISYKIESKKTDDVEWYYRPLIDKNHFFFFGYCFFIVPNIKNENEKVHIVIKWQDFPEDWAIANSFILHKKRQSLHVPIHTFLHSVFTGGDFQILQCGNKARPVSIAIRGKWAFKKKQLMKLVETVIESQRVFWNDFDFPHYLVTMIQVNGPHMGGTGSTNAFSIFSSDISDENEKDWKWLAWLLSHEHFHTWNGMKLQSQGPEGRLFWFTEGFTEYYAVTLNLRNGLITEKDYREHINKMLYEYFASPVHNASNQAIEQGFWTHFDVQRIPYCKGFTLALSWDKKIREQSLETKSLDDFMKAFHKRVLLNNQPFSLEDIRQVATHFLPEHVVFEDLERGILQGETLYPPSFGINKDSLQWMENVGFNQHLTCTTHTIDGVQVGSPAHKAGLQNGQTFVRHQITPKTISVFIKNPQGLIQEIQYLREMNSRLIPQYIDKG